MVVNVLFNVIKIMFWMFSVFLWEVVFFVVVGFVVGFVIGYVRMFGNLYSFLFFGLKEVMLKVVVNVGIGLLRLL